MVRKKAVKKTISAATKIAAVKKKHKMDLKKAIAKAYKSGVTDTMKKVAKKAKPKKAKKAKSRKAKAKK